METCKLIIWDMQIAYPTVGERVMLYWMLVNCDVGIWTPEDEWMYNDFCRVVSMTEHEMDWFARL